MLQMLLHNAKATLLQNAIEVYYKMRQGCYYKLQEDIGLFCTLLYMSKNIYKISINKKTYFFYKIVFLP